MLFGGDEDMPVEFRVPVGPPSMMRHRSEKEAAKQTYLSTFDDGETIPRVSESSSCSRSLSREKRTALIVRPRKKQIVQSKSIKIDAVS